MTFLTLVWLRWVAYALLLASIVPMVVVISQLVRARRAPYYAVREIALKRVKRWALVALMLLVLGVDVLVVPPRLAAVLPRPEDLTPEPPTPTLTVIITRTVRPTRAPTSTPTRRPTATAPFIPTPTSAVPPPASALTPLPSAVPAGENARITIVTLAADYDEDGQPVDPGAEFPPGDHHVYLFIAYEGMANGVAWTFAIYREGEFLDSSTQLWEWGAQGKTYLYYKPPGGYELGVYEMRVFVGERLQGVAQFAITDGVNE
ncbi:MAG: hypothetical protein V3S14_01780 [Anaerolineae bacterium]